MTTTYQERPRNGGGTECCLDFNGDHDHTVARTKENKWRRLLPIGFTAPNAQKARAGTPTPLPLTSKQAEWLTKLAWRHREQMPRELVPAQNPYELNPPATPKHKFKCDDCGHVLWFAPNDDPTSSSGSCKNCGGKRLNTYDQNGDEIE